MLGLWDSRDGVRYAGWVLEMSGLGFTAAGVSRLRKEFAPERLSAAAETRRVLSSGVGRLLVRLHLRPPPPTTVAASTIETRWEVQPATVRLDLADVPEGATTRRTPDLLEQQVRGLCTRDNDLTRSITEERRERHQEVAAERTARSDELSKVDARVRDLAAGGLSLEAFGLGCLFFGVTFASIPDGVAWALRLASPW